VVIKAQGRSLEEPRGRSALRDRHARRHRSPTATADENPQRRRGDNRRGQVKALRKRVVD
jgi:hypothetical protein